MQNLVQQLAGGIRTVGLSPGESLERERRQRVDVSGWLAHRLSGEPLGRDIGERPYDLVFGGDLGQVTGGRGAQVDQLDAAVLGDQDVRWLHVAMDDAVLVGVVDS